MEGSGHSLVVELQPSKLIVTVRFRLPAFLLIFFKKGVTKEEIF